MLSWAVVKFALLFAVGAGPESYAVLMRRRCPALSSAAVHRGLGNESVEAIVVVFHFLYPGGSVLGGYRILCRAGSIFTMVT